MIGKEEQRPHSRKENTFSKNCVDQLRLGNIHKEHMIQLINSLKMFSLLQRQQPNTVSERWGNEGYISFLIGMKSQIFSHRDLSAIYDFHLSTQFATIQLSDFYHTVS